MLIRHVAFFAWLFQVMDKVDVNVAILRHRAGEQLPRHQIRRKDLIASDLRDRGMAMWPFSGMLACVRDSTTAPKKAAPQRARGRRK